MVEFHAAFQNGRSGDEPMHARSPLRLRLALTGFGLLAAIAGIVVFAMVDVPALVGVFAAFAALSIADAAIVLRHINAGADYQPGREVPPYRPRRRGRSSSAPEHPEAGPGRRHARFLWAGAASLVLIINAWTWISSISTGAAAVLSILAGALLLLGVFTANAASPALRGNSVPDTELESATEYEDWDRAAMAESEPQPTRESEPAPEPAPEPEPEPESGHHSRRKRHAVLHR